LGAGTCRHGCTARVRNLLKMRKQKGPRIVTTGSMVTNLLVAAPPAHLATEAALSAASDAASSAFRSLGTLVCQHCRTGSGVANAQPGSFEAPLSRRRRCATRLPSTGKSRSETTLAAMSAAHAPALHTGSLAAFVTRRTPSDPQAQAVQPPGQAIDHWHPLLAPLEGQLYEFADTRRRVCSECYIALKGKQVLKFTCPTESHHDDLMGDESTAASSSVDNTNFKTGPK